jgi:hypothetical protein
MIATFYDQTHPKASVGRIAEFRKTSGKLKPRQARRSGRKVVLPEQVGTRGV